MPRLFLSLLLAAAAAAPAAAQTDLPPVRIILVGDSTVALGNGWGPGFCALAAPQVKCLDLAKNGRSSSSYRAEGLWATAMKELTNSDKIPTYVLIQFGHNDQPGKPGRSTDLATEFPVNMRGYVKDVAAAGAHPVLVTSLTRRSFRNGVVENGLAPWADATKKVAAEAGVPVLDLNTESLAAVQKMGQTEANSMAVAPPPQNIRDAAASGNPNSLNAPKDGTPPLFDYTHLGEKGSAFFGHMVAHEFVTAVPALAPYFKL